MTSPTTSTKTAGKPCPICGKPADQKLRPFCSRRCADVDLHRWLSGVYAIPAVEAQDAGDSDGDPPMRESQG